jgi:hypothetical protein
VIHVLNADDRREQLGNFVRASRIQAGLTIEQTAERITRNAATTRHHGLVLSLIEDGRHLPTDAYIDRIVAVLPINPRLLRTLAAPTASATRH